MSVEEARTAQRERFEKWADDKKIGDGDGKILPKGFLRETFWGVWQAAEAFGLREAARIVRAQKDKHANLLAKNVLEMAAAELEQATKGGI